MEIQSAALDRGTHRPFVNNIKSGIAEASLERVRTIPLLEYILVGEHLCLPRLVDFHGPMHDIDPMGEQVSQGAAAKIPEPAPTKEFFLVVGLVGRGPKPKLPIERLLVYRLGRPVPLIVLPPVGSYLYHAAQTARLDQIDGISEMRPTALLICLLERTARSNVLPSSSV